MFDQNRPWQKSPQAAAIYYANLGLTVFPVSAAKVPLLRGWPKLATTDLEVIVSWWRQFPYAEVGWSLPDSIVVIDLDVKPGKNGYRDFDRLTGVSADKFPTPQASSPSGGRHLLCRAGGKKYVSAVSIAGTGVDLKTHGGFIVMPGAGNGRHWLPGKPSKPAPIPREIAALSKPRPDPNAPPPSREDRSVEPPGRLPDGVLGAPEGCMSRYGRAALTGVCEAIRAACNGSQEITLNNGMLKVAMLIGARELPASAKHAVLEAGLAMPSYDPRRPWTREQIEKKIDHALADGLKKVIRT